MLYSIIVVAVLGVLIFWLNRWKKLPEEQRAKTGKQYVLWGLIVILLALVMTGRAHWLMGVLAALLALVGRLAQFAPYLPIFKKIFGEAQAGPSGGEQPASMRSSMSRQDAADILGVEIHASSEEIRMAHKKLMQKIHPDRGGSDALAKQINRAKDILLK